MDTLFLLDYSRETGTFGKLIKVYRKEALKMRQLAPGEIEGSTRKKARLNCI